jgi:arylsulfatase A-like enzyme
MHLLGQIGRRVILAGLVSAALCLTCLAPGLAVQAAEARPNLVLLLADDLGYGDLGCYGCPDIRTPHLDRLARQGVRLTQFYANGPECTPTRAALLSGRYPQRPGGLECAIGLGNVGRYDDAIRLAMRRELGLPVAHSVLARGLKAAGYETAIVGKWHLGYEPQFAPRRHGFDRFFGPLGGAVDYFFHCEPGGQPMLYENEQPVTRDGYLTDLIADEVCQYLRHARQPFFLYVPFTAPHSPYQGPKDRSDAPVTLEASNRGSRATYAAMVQRLDEAIGRILATLEETGAASSTLVLFASDNGGTTYSRNAPFSGQKGSTYEGGIRVPCLLRWPGKLPAGTTSEEIGIMMDLTASLLAAAGATPPDGIKLDGVDLIGALQRGEPLTARTLYWRQRRGDRTWRGVRDGPWKLVSRADGSQRRDQLFNLDSDPAEQHDLAAEQPQRLQRLLTLLARWEEEVRPAR